MKTNKFYLLIAAVLTFLFSLPPTQTLAQESIIDRLDKSLGVKLPAEYEAKVRDLLKNSNVFKVKGADDCTAQFIENWMRKDWKIDKQNQLVFLWHCIYKKITDDDLYNPEDGDSNRLQDFNDRVVGMRIRAAGQGYENEIVAYMNKVSEEVQRQSEDAQRQSIDKGLESLTEFINYFDKYITSFKDVINLDGVTQTLSDLNQEKNTLLNRAEKLRSEHQSNQQPSANEAENLKKAEEQLLSDITKQRTDVVKQIYAVIEKNIPEIEMNWEDEYSDFLFHPDFDINELRDKNKRWALSIDLSEGGGGDNSILNLFNIRMKNKEQVKNIDPSQSSCDQRSLF